VQTVLIIFFKNEEIFKTKTLVAQFIGAILAQCTPMFSR